MLMWEEAAIKDDVIEYDIAFNIIYIMRTNGKDGRIWRESLTLAVNYKTPLERSRYNQSGPLSMPNRRRG